ncbi:MAG: PEP-CTERM sorting domain-containing protein [Phycisphaerales bacterium]|nr:PEP-CTERM sorting domain-containing protein [Phycisphaerales bacterium]
MKQAILVVSVVVGLGFVARAGGAVSYTIERTGRPTGATWSRGVALNDFGQIAITTGSRGHLWTPGVGFESLGLMTPEGSSIYIQDINNAAQITGYEVGGGTRGFIWTNGSWTGVGNLDPSPNGGSGLSRPRGINDNGLVVGDSKVFVNYTAFRYNGTINPLARPGVHAYAYDINSSNHAAGTVQKYDGNYVGYAYIWDPDGTPHELGLGGASAINDHGQVAGGSGGSPGVWDVGGTFRPYGILPYDRHSNGGIGDINNQGQTVGYSRNSGTGIYDRRYATLWDPDGTIHDLNTMVTGLNGWRLVQATGINQHGQICGYGSADQYAGSDQQGFLLTPSNFRNVGDLSPVDLGLGQTGGAQATFGSIVVDGSFFAEYAVRDSADIALMYGALPDNVPQPTLQCWQAEFTGEFAGGATVVFQYDPVGLQWPEEDLHILHWTGSSWETLPGVIDLLGNTISVDTTSLSPFLLVPEPTTLTLLTLGGLAVLRRRRKR